jgi:single-strand DNA-binding protein
MTLNRLTLIGFVGADAEQKANNKGSAYTVFSVATKTSWKNADGAWDSRTEWHRCVANGKIADFAATLKKGAHLQVEGELRSREYEKDGVTRKLFECRVGSILKLDRAERQEEPNEGDDAVS